MFSNASNFVINQPTFIDNGSDALQLLSQYVAQGATHDSRDQYANPKCHPDTRKWLLGVIKEWMLEPEKETGILYLHGPAGAGKSCITRSACEHGGPAGFLLASFFFWRSSEYRNNAMRLVTTIAYQLVRMNSELAEHIVAEIQHDPRIIYDAPLEYQFRKLVLEPVRRVADTSNKQLNGVIIIDGLDECVDKEAQVSVIELMATMVYREGFPLGFFVTSRPELHLKEVWDTEDIAQAAQFISLSNIGNTSNDIRTVLESGFSRILNDRRFKEALQSVRRPWPSSSDVETLVERSSGQFIYAATVMKFVSNRSRNPDAQLQIVLALPACGSDTSPLADLDSLYHEILSRADDPARTIKVLSFLLAIMDLKELRRKLLSVSVIVDPFTISIFADVHKQLLIVEQLMSLPRREAFLALNDLHALIDLRDCSPISFYHKSFIDFLLTSGRSKEFYVDLKATHAEIVQSCVKFLCLPKYNTAEQHVGWLYSLFLWHLHIDKSSSREQVRNFEQPIQRFIGTQLRISHLLLKGAFKILGLEEEQSVVIEVAEVLTGFRRLSASTFHAIACELWNSHVGRLNDEILSIKESSICGPLLVTHLESYRMDLLTVKRSLAIHAVVPFSTLFNSGLCSTGIIHHLASLPEIQEDMIQSDLFGSGTPWFLKFLSDQWSSGIFSCTPEDFAEAYSEIISISMTSDYLNRQEYEYSDWWKRQERKYSREYSNLLEIWICRLHDIDPPATPGFLAALKSAAQTAYRPSLNRLLTRKAEEPLLKWLKNLPSPPHDIIDAWQKSFDEAGLRYPVLQRLVQLSGSSVESPPEQPETESGLRIFEPHYY